MLLGNLASGSGGNLISGSSLVGGPPWDRAELLLLSPAWPASGRWRERSAEPRPCRSFLDKDASVSSVCVLCSFFYIYVYLGLIQKRIGGAFRRTDVTAG